MPTVLTQLLRTQLRFTEHIFYHRGRGGKVGKGGGGFFYSLPTFLCHLIRNCSDAPFSLGNNVRAVFHHRAHRDHREGALVRVLGKEVSMRILIATNFLKKRAKSICYILEK
jgi:hypothetical protein